MARLKRSWLLPRVLLTTQVLLLPAVTVAQNSNEVQQLSSDGEHMKALVAYEALPKRRATVDATIAAGRSAWALSLPDRATEEFDRALTDESLSGVDRARVFLSKGIIEFQEGRYQVAKLYADKTIELLDEAGPLRAKAYLLSGQSLAKLNDFGASESALQSALDESLQDEKPEVHFQLGECRLKLNKLDQAKENFESIPLGNERTAVSIRHLSEIALEKNELGQAAFWLTKGRSEYSDNFLDSWVDYALVKTAIGEGNLDEALKLQADAMKRLPPSDYWLTLLNAGIEAFKAKTATSGGGGE